MTERVHDVQTALAHLHNISEERARLKKEYEELRDEVVKEMTGPEFFLDEHGVKRIAIKVMPEIADVDMTVLEDQVPESVLDDIAPRKLDKERFSRAVAAGRIRQEVFLQAVSVHQGNPFVRWAEADNS